VGEVRKGPIFTTKGRKEKGEKGVQGNQVTSAEKKNDLQFVLAVTATTTQRQGKKCTSQVVFDVERQKPSAEGESVQDLQRQKETQGTGEEKAPLLLTLVGIKGRDERRKKEG